MVRHAAPAHPERALFAATARDARARSRLAILAAVVGALALAAAGIVIALGLGPAGPWPPV